MKYLIKTIIGSQLAIGLLLTLTQSLKAESSIYTCGAYGKVGQIFSEALLPITAQNLMKFVNGVSPALQQEIAIKLLSRMNDEEALAINKISDENKKLLFEMAGFKTIEALMQGQASTPEAIHDKLYQQCVTEGVDSLIEEIR